LGVSRTGFLLPLFFAFTGLRTQIGLLNDWISWLIVRLRSLVAIAGSWVAVCWRTRWTGMNWRDSFSLGALMNTRGLIELIVLNIGYDLGILSPRIFINDGLHGSGHDLHGYSSNGLCGVEK
jgi:Kef-type K+ transport system membrane component KefB